MGPETSSKTALVPCPSCGGRVRLGAPWCQQCYADLRPRPAVQTPAPVAPLPAVAVPAAPPAPVPAALDPLTAPLALLLAEGAGSSSGTASADAPEPLRASAAGWPCTGCGAVNDWSSESCASCGLAFLAALKGDGTVLELPVVGDIGSYTRSQRLTFACMLVLALLILLTGFGALLG